MSDRKYVRLLVIDEHVEHYEQICEYADMYNSQFRIECKSVLAGESVMSLIGSWQPSVILLDVHVSDANGIEVLRNCAETGIPVVATSGIRSQDIAESVFESGAVGYFPKSENPDDIETLLELVASVAASVDPAQ